MTERTTHLIIPISLNIYTKIFNFQVQSNPDITFKLLGIWHEITVFIFHLTLFIYRIISVARNRSLRTNHQFIA